MGRRLTQEEAKAQVAQFGCELIGEYNGAFEPATIKCVCGNIRTYTRFNSFVCRKGHHLCDECSVGGRDILSREEVNKKLNKVGCSLVGEYIGFDQDITVLCVCGHTRTTILNKFLNKRSSKLCEKCTNKNHKTGNIKIVERFKKLGYEIIDNFGNNVASNKMGVMDKVGYKYLTNIYNAERNFKRNGKPERFCRNNPFTFENMNLWLKLNNKDFEVIELIVEEYLRVVSRCYICGGKWETGWDSITGYNTDCPLCRASSGEVEMRQFFNKNKIKYDTEHTFLDCKFVHRLPFDFYLPEYNTVCEYSGIQHFESIDFGNKGKEWAEKEFRELQVRDAIKVEYCVKNNIPLLVIPYWEFDRIPEILSDYLHLDNSPIL